MPRKAKEKVTLHLDCIPPHEAVFSKMEDALGSLARFYGFERIRTSLIEDARTFAPLAKAGFFLERSPVSCKTRSSGQALLRPSGAIGTLRAYISHGMQESPHPVKLFFQGEAYHAPRQMGARQGAALFSVPEWGVTMIGEEGPVAEAEVIQVVWRALQELGIDTSTLGLRVNATGCGHCRVAFRSSFNSFLRSRAQRLCRGCRKNIKQFPSRIFLCGEEPCRVISNQAPQVLDFLCDLCKKHLRGLLEFLDEGGIPYFLDSRLFREGSWYNTSVFEFTAPREKYATENPEDTPDEKSRVVLAEGGRVSRAAELISGRAIPAVSGLVFLSALARTFTPKESKKSADAENARVFLLHLGELAKRRSLGVLEELRRAGIAARESLGRDAIKSQLKVAERFNAEIALILGHKEALDNTIIVRDVQSGIQETIPQEKLVEFLKKKLKK